MLFILAKGNSYIGSQVFCQFQKLSIWLPEFLFICFTVKIEQQVLGLKCRTMLNLYHPVTFRLVHIGKPVTNMAKTLEFVIERVENILGKGQNAGYHHFLLFPKMFSKALFLGLVKTGDSVIKL